MNELQVVVKQQVGKINWNFEELKTALAAEMEKYTGIVYDDDSIADAKNTVAYLRNLKRYVLKYVSTGGQMNIFDMEQQAENDADIVDSETPAIEGQPTYFLPDNQTDAKSEEPQEEEQNSETDGIMTVPDNVDEETDTDVPSGGYGSTDDSGMPLPFSEDDDYYPYDEPMEE